ncbi:cation:proton antiporter [Uliginosibacterium sediminicola]|uniref:Cation:proton antiporter n=1 Tax=Uliginosibacterium sediminicola TaxID=2024550 RepID=A0ABU9YZT4_9RHOO
MIELAQLFRDMAWPIAILIAWFAGEYAYQWIKLPRISTYAVVGFVLAPTQIGLLPQTQAPMLLLANIAFGLMLFECGYRINLRWLRANPWLAASSLTESALTFVAVYIIASWFGLSLANALLLATLSMATSPATILRIINEQRSAGQVTERVLHLAALNCVLSVLAFKIVVGFVVLQTSGSLWQATYSSLIVLVMSLLLGAIAGALIPALLRLTKRTGQDCTLAFTIAVIGIVALAHSLKLSPILTALMFGLSARHHRIVLATSQRGFGALGDLLSILLFVFIASSLEWRHVTAGVGLGFAIIMARQIAKIGGITLFAHLSGISLRKGVLIGVASTPLSAFVILVLEQTRYLGISLVDQLSSLAAAALSIEIFGPILVQRALVWANEVPDRKEF